MKALFAFSLLQPSCLHLTLLYTSCRWTYDWRVEQSLGSRLLLFRRNVVFCFSEWSAVMFACVVTVQGTDRLNRDLVFTANKWLCFFKLFFFAMFQRQTCVHTYGAVSNQADSAHAAHVGLLWRFVETRSPHYRQLQEKHQEHALSPEEPASGCHNGLQGLLLGTRREVCSVDVWEKDLHSFLCRG